MAGHPRIFDLLACSSHSGALPILVHVRHERTLLPSSDTANTVAGCHTERYEYTSQKEKTSANLLVISSATHASQLCALALPSVRTQDKHRGSAIWTHDRCALLVSTLEMHVPTPQARLPTLTPHPSASTTLASIRALVDGVAFLDARPTRSAKPKMIRIEPP